LRFPLKGAAPVFGAIVIAVRFVNLAVSSPQYQFAGHSQIAVLHRFGLCMLYLHSKVKLPYNENWRPRGDL